MPEQQLDEEQHLHTDKRQRRPYPIQIRKYGSTVTRSTAFLLIVLLGLVVFVTLTRITFFVNLSDSSSVTNNDAFLILLFACAGFALSLPCGFLLGKYHAKRSKYPTQPIPAVIEEAPDARSKLAFYSDLQKKEVDKSIILGIRILESPLTAQNVTTLLSAFAQFYAKCWLIANRRFADLMDYTQTHNVQLATEVGLLISKVSYNSPFNIDWKVDASIQGLAEAVATAIDSVTQVRQRLEKAELENQQKEQELKQAAQKADQEIQIALLGNEKAALEIEKQRLDLLEKRLDVQKKGIDYALEIASKTVDVLHPNADSETRAMIIQTLLPNILQFQNGKGLELALPAPQNGKNEGTEDK